MFNRVLYFMRKNIFHSKLNRVKYIHNIEMINKIKYKNKNKNKSPAWSEFRTRHTSKFVKFVTVQHVVREPYHHNTYNVCFQTCALRCIQLDRNMGTTSSVSTTDF